MTNTVALSPFEILARYERLSLGHLATTPQHQESSGQWRGIGYRVGSRLLVSAIDEIGELLAVPLLTPVPGTQAWLLGVANVRGNLVPVVDLGRFLFGERTAFTTRSRLLLIKQAGGNVALLVDEVLGQRVLDATDRQASPESDERLARFVEECVGEQQMALFDMNKLVRAPDFRHGAA